MTSIYVYAIRYQGPTGPCHIPPLYATRELADQARRDILKHWHDLSKSGHGTVTGTLHIDRLLVARGPATQREMDFGNDA